MNKISYDEYRRRTNHGAYWYNLTPHSINLVISEVNPRTPRELFQVLCVEFPPSNSIARVEFDEPTVQVIDGFTIHENVPIKGLINLPSYVPNINLLVSALVREQLRGKNRFDVFSPDTGLTALRNDKGGVFAVRALQRA
jgi:hypothetical protein